MAEQSRIDEFLDLYKQLEDALEDKYRNARRHYSSVVFEFAKDDDSIPVRDKLDICREIRNLLTHNPNLEGEPIVEPSEPVLRAMQEVVDYVRRPPLAIDYATKGDQVMKATLGQKVLRLMEIMDKNGYSHIPVMKEGQFCGVFSVGTLFQYLLRSGGQFCLVYRTERLAELMETLRRHRLEPKVLRFVQKDAQTPPRLVLLLSLIHI